MGSLFKPPSMPDVPAPPPIPPAAIPATQANPQVQQARANQEGSAAKALAGGTIRTTAQGDLSKPTTATTSLLGG